MIILKIIITIAATITTLAIIIITELLRGNLELREVTKENTKNNSMEKK